MQCGVLVIIFFLVEPCAQLHQLLCDVGVSSLDRDHEGCGVIAVSFLVDLRVIFNEKVDDVKVFSFVIDCVVESVSHLVVDVVDPRIPHENFVD